MAATTTVQKNDTHSSHHKLQYSSLHNRVLEDAYCYIDCFRALPGPKNYLPAADLPKGVTRVFKVIEKRVQCEV
ncbi:hypothetical protein DPMN_046222 [Dreissena polymorpha]|uniref:Uncharacterized protein n=1 Tax=Dreissena polymorpha TaxID=45954 RepID=A0A9D4I0E8_DREPO|nr:hypothetical protein DPMN_046222 [Dreissena polymorpha]